MGFDPQRSGPSGNDQEGDRLGALARFAGMRVWDLLIVNGSDRMALAKSLRMHETNLKQLTSGEHLGTKATMDRISRILSVDVSHFFGGPLIRYSEEYLPLDERLTHWVREYFEDALRNENVMLWLCERCGMTRSGLLAVLRGRSNVSYTLMLSLTNLGVGYVNVLDLVAPVRRTVTWTRR